METLILAALGILALTIVFRKTWRTIKGFSRNYEANNCTGCDNCCSSCHENKED